MDETALDLPRLLHPVEPEVFFRDFWEREALLVGRDDPAHYDGLFALRDVESVIAFTRPKFASPDDLMPGGAARSFIQGLLPDDEAAAGAYPDLGGVRAAFARGKTLILTAMQCRWGPVAALCRRLEERFGCPVHTNLYLSPPGAQGFDAHYDTHEVFVLQIEGAKHWRLYGSARELPLAEERATFARGKLGPPTREATLRPGDLLYLPRGHVHEAFTSDRLSLHLTVGVKVYRWSDLLHQVVDAVSARDVRFRASLPPGLLTNCPAAAAGERLRELLTALAEGARADEAVGRLATAFLSRLAPLPGGSFAVPDPDAIGPDTVLERVPGAICREVEVPDGRAGLQFPGGSLEGPPKTAAALHFIAHAPRFTARSLPGGLTPDARLLLVRRLVRDGLLRLAPGLHEMSPPSGGA
jgi:hypothetical protein